VLEEEPASASGLKVLCFFFFGGDSDAELVEVS
jgi:hypothetical protein